MFVLGDLNDETGAVTTEMITGEMPFRAWGVDVKRRYWDVELYSAVRSHLRRTEHSSIHTHIFNGHYGTLDHVLISQEFSEPEATFPGQWTMKGMRMASS